MVLAWKLDRTISTKVHVQKRLVETGEAHCIRERTHPLFYTARAPDREENDRQNYRTPPTALKGPCQVDEEVYESYSEVGISTCNMLIATSACPSDETLQA